MLRVQNDGVGGLTPQFPVHSFVTPNPLVEAVLLTLIIHNLNHGYASTDTMCWLLISPHIMLHWKGSLRHDWPAQCIFPNGHWEVLFKIWWPSSLHMNGRIRSRIYNNYNSESTNWPGPCHYYNRYTYWNLQMSIGLQEFADFSPMSLPPLLDFSFHWWTINSPMASMAFSHWLFPTTTFSPWPFPPIRMVCILPLFGLIPRLN